ncbi:acetyl-CoA acetyltransferase [Mycolicibacterium rhodesiae JS60]|nr:acetyl-CoA acetyltransferase [Mycolicibacterium rhodesiae JS60]
MTSSAYIIDGVRTPRGEGKPTGGLHHLHPQELLAQVLNALGDRAKIPLEDVEDVIVGNGSNDGDHGQNIARMSVLAAGWPVEIPGTTVNRFCGSGQQAVIFGAQGVASGFQDVVVAGGVESTSRWLPPAGTLGAGNDALRRKHPMIHQGVAADLIASLEGFSRTELDEFAVMSQRRAGAAVRENRFARSLIEVHNQDGTLALAVDEHPREATTVEVLAKLKPSFTAIGASVDNVLGRSQDEIALELYPDAGEIQHHHHAGNSSGRVDGAAAIMLASSRYTEAHGITPRARIVSVAVTAAEPVIMLTAPTSASRLCLERANMTVDDIDLWEINEAFATVPLKTIRDLGIESERVNVNGGAIALGHPIGASGAILIQTALDELERRDLNTALITLCTGGGMATATVIERCH